MLNEALEIYRAYDVAKAEKEAGEESKEKKSPSTPGESSYSIQSVRLIIKRCHNTAHDNKEMLETDAKLEIHSEIDSICSDICNNLAACFETQGNFEDARRFFEESLKMRKLIYGPLSEKVAECLQNIGTVNDKVRQASLLLFFPATSVATPVDFV